MKSFNFPLFGFRSPLKPDWKKNTQHTKFYTCKFKQFRNQFYFPIRPYSPKKIDTLISKKNDVHKILISKATILPFFHAIYVKILLSQFIIFHFYLSAIWLPDGELWVTIEGAVSLTRCYSLCLLILSRRLPRAS